MIRVDCAGCGKAFQARDEHAGRRGRCPHCGATVQVPGVRASPPASAAAPAPATPAVGVAPPTTGAGPVGRGAGPVGAGAGTTRAGGTRAGSVRGSRGALGSRGASGAGASGRSGRGQRAGASEPSEAADGEVTAGHGVPRWFLPVLVLVVVLVVVIVLVTRPEPVGRQHLTEGSRLLGAGRFEDAIERFGRIAEGDDLYAEAQAKIAQARDGQQAVRAKAERALADNHYEIVMSLRRDYVDRAGPASEWYVPYCRYMLKHARRFLETWPDDPRAAEVQALFPYYVTVVPNPDAPPTEADVKADVYMSIQRDQPGRAMASVEEFAALSPEAARKAEPFRAELATAASDGWRAARSRLTSDGTLDAQGNSRNWAQVYEVTQHYLDGVEGIPGAGAEARSLRDTASQHLKIVTGGG